MHVPVSDIVPVVMGWTARAVAAVVGFGALVVLLGYALDIDALVSASASLPGVSPLTALAAACAGAAIALDTGPAARARRLGWVAVAIGAAALVATAIGGRETVSPWIAAHLFGVDPGRSGCIAGPTATCLLALGIACVGRDRPRLADWAGAVAVGIAGFAVLDEIYQSGTLQHLPLFGPMALRTAIGLVLLAFASLTVRPTQGWAAVAASAGPGGASTRRLIAFIPLPPLVGWLLVRVAEVDHLGTGPALAALVVLIVVPLALLMLRGGRILDELEAERRTKAELQAARDRELRLVADALPVLVAFVDRSLTYRFANLSYKEWTGLTPEEIVGRRMQDIMPAQDMASREAHIDAALDGREARFEHAWRLPDGIARDAEIRYLPRLSASGLVEGFFVFVTDVTERKSAERRLLATKEALEVRVEARTRERDRVWQASKDMLCIATLDGYLVSLNPAWEQTLGWPLEALTARPFTELVHPDDLESTRRAADGLARGEPAFAFENRYRHAGGGWRWLSWNAVPEGDRIYASARDVTDAKAAAERERGLEDSLHQAQKMEAVGQLTGGLAHDFNNLLTGITGSLDLLSLRVTQGRTGELSRYVDAAQGAAKRAAALTHRLLAFARRQTLDPEPTDIDRLVAGLEELIRRTVGPEIEVAIVREPELWRVLIDPNQLENALLNLCINARDAIDGGGRIAIATGNRTLDAEAASARGLAPGAYVVLQVEDTGAGMPPDVIARIFDPFFTTKPLGQGTGLGLSMIYGFVRQSGGQVAVDSAVGNGTTMSLYLPRHAGPAEGEGAAVPDAPQRAESGETILVVDDEPTVRLLVVEVLEELGYRTLEAADARAALDILESAAVVDLLVTDVGLPGGMNGRQLAEAGRQARPGLKVLFITGYADATAHDAARLPPGMRLLAKPFAMDALAGAVTEMIAG